jgi:hypothetical protein
VLPGADDWFAANLERLAGELGTQLAAHWQASFCTAPGYTADTAARCALGGTLPAAGRAALARLFGGDLDHVVERFAGPGPSHAP